MRPQTIGLIAGSVVTAAFLAAVGLVLAWPILTAPREVAGVQQIGQIFGQDPQAPAEQPLPVKELPKVRGAVVAAKDYTLSDAHAHGNLTIFLVHGKDTMNKGNIITLGEGLERGGVTVRDTGFNLTVDNRSNATLFIQAGDIVKGGNQDRTLPYDMLVPANTEGTLTAALCVEQGRSSPRGNEISHSFATSTEQLPGRQLRLAAYKHSQNEVWNNVRTLQDNLARNAGGSVQAPVSATSLQLSLEHERVHAAAQDYLAALAPKVEGHKDVIGFVAVVNGKIQSADIYASNALFLKLWPKLIRASAVEAIAERNFAANDAPDADAVQAFLTAAEKGNAVRLDANRGTVIRHDSAAAIVHDTCASLPNNLVLHRSVLSK